MRQAGASAPVEIAEEREAWDESDALAGEAPSATYRPITGGRSSAVRAPSTPRVSRQPPPDPIAFEVAERYARALTLDATAPPPAPPEPRRSRAAMRDRERDRAGRPARRAPDRPEPPADRAPSRPTLAADTAPDRALRLAASARASSRPAPADPAPAPPARRTVTIRGRGAERDLAWTGSHSRRRQPMPAHERPGFRPDRAALWAVVLGLLLVLVAATSSHAAVLAHAIR